MRAVAHLCACNRKAEQPRKHPACFRSTLQVDVLDAPAMQSKSDFGTVVWSGSSVCPGLERGFNTSRAFMEYDDQIQLSHRFPILWL